MITTLTGASGYVWVPTTIGRHPSGMRRPAPLSISFTQGQISSDTATFAETECRSGDQGQARVRGLTTRSCAVTAKGNRDVSRSRGTQDAGSQATFWDLVME